MMVDKGNIITGRTFLFDHEELPYDITKEKRNRKTFLSQS